MRRIVAAVGPRPGETVIEIGPGRGALTRELVPICEHLILIEKDTRYAGDLADRFIESQNVKVVEGDATSIDLDQFGVGPFAVVGNLPYNVGGQIVFNLLAQRHKIRSMVLMLQREVAQRFCAEPNSREFGAASLLIRCQANPKYLFDVSRDRFIPKPKVHSGVIEIVPGGPGSVMADEPDFARLAHALFAQPRKTVINSLSDGTGRPKAEIDSWLGESGIEPSVRPQNVSPEKFLDLYNNRLQSLQLK